MPKPTSNFDQLISAYMLAHDDPAIPYENGIPLTWINCITTGSWHITFRRDGEVFSTHISTEELLGWMWAKMSAALTS